jgi:hypothetical protein
LSRLRSTRGAKAPSRPAGGRPGVFVQSPQSDIYVVMLSIALGAILLASLLLALIMNEYGFSTQVSSLMTGSSAQLLA